jgi:short-chain Z-isoprenyl diphosphate synthase
MPHLLRMTGLYALYTRRLRRQVLTGRLPEHVGLIMDGNRRWARRVGLADPGLGHRVGAEVAYLIRVIEEVVTARLARPEARWQVHAAGMLDVLPDSTARALKDAVEATRDCVTGAHVTLAIGYGGRQEIIDAVRDLLIEADAAGMSMADPSASARRASESGTLRGAAFVPLHGRPPVDSVPWYGR